MLKALILDLDGTLIDTVPDIVRSVNELRRERGFTSLNRGQILKGVGKGIETLLQSCLGSYVDQAQLLKDIERYQWIYSQLSSKARPFPHVRRGLAQIRKAVPALRLAVVTNKTTRLAVETLKIHLPGYPWEQVRGPETVTQRKPHPAHLLETLADMALDIKEILYVGDDVVDRDLARACGCEFIGAEWGYGNLTQASYPDSKICESFEGVVEAVIRSQSYG
jgi:phosphoglycolate phosphatase